MQNLTKQKDYEYKEGQKKLLVGVRHDATDEAGFGRHQHVDQVVQLVPEVGADGLEVGHLGRRLGLDHDAPLAATVARRGEVLLLLGLAGMVHQALVEEGAAGGLLEEVHDGVVDGVAVLVQPARHVVGDDACRGQLYTNRSSRKIVSR